MSLQMDKFTGSNTTKQVVHFLTIIYNDIVKKSIKADTHLPINASVTYDEFVDFECVIWVPMPYDSTYPYTDIENSIIEYCIFGHGFVPSCCASSLYVGDTHLIKISLDIPIKFFNNYINYYKLKNSSEWKEQTYCLNV